jgi:hypothetical protein
VGLLRAFAASVFLLATLGTDAAMAVSITNRDDSDQKVTVIEGDSTKDHILKPSAVLEGVCGKGCVVRLNDSENDEYELEGTEVVSIEDGYLYYDVAAAPMEPVPGEDGKADSPKR